MSANLIEPKIGDKLVDNDPRMGKRILTIVEILPNSVAAEDRCGRVFKYLRKRIHADGKARTSGMSLLRLGEQA